MVRILDARIRPLLLKTLIAGADASLLSSGRPRTAEFGSGIAKFNQLDKRISQFVEERAAELIRDVDETTRRALRKTIVDAIDGQIGRVKLAQQLRASVGMTRRQAATRAKVEAEKGRKAAERYEAKAIRDRAQTIAITETLRAANEGQVRLWDQQIAAGNLPQTAARVWIALDDACPVCAPLNGQTAPVRGSFPGGLSGPPAHPRCKCAQGLTFDARPAEPTATDFFNAPENFTLADAGYDVSTQYPRDLMVVGWIDIAKLSSGYGNDYRVRRMAESIQGGTKFPALTLELQEPKRGAKTGTLNVLDGQTRIAAFRERGIRGRVPVVIRIYDYGGEEALPDDVQIDVARTRSLRKDKEQQ